MKTRKQLEKEIENLKKREEDIEDEVNQLEQYSMDLFEFERLKATLTQTNEIIKLIEELKEIYVRTKVSDYSEGYSNGAISVCENLLTKIMGDDLR
jgi:hypothetical protein